MFETSKDILNIVLAISIASISFFFCWGLYYLVMSGRQVFKLISSLKERLDKIDEAVTAFKHKVESSTSYLLLIGEGVKKLVELMKERESKNN